VSLHAQPRATNDIDLLIRPDADNARAVYAALGKFGAPLEGLTAEDFIERDKFFRMGHAPIIVDILPEIKGVDFDRAWQNRVEVVIDPESGLTAPFISSEDLIAAKLAAGRPQDIADVAALRKATVHFHLPKPQKLRQTSERDCAVPVFAALAGVSEDEVCRDLPNASLGEVSVDQWKGWLEKRGFRVLKVDGCPTEVVPCAHLVGSDEPRDERDFHWVYRDVNANVHDPDPAFKWITADDPRMKNLSFYPRKVLTLLVSPRATN